MNISYKSSWKQTNRKFGRGQQNPSGNLAGLLGDNFSHEQTLNHSSQFFFYAEGSLDTRQKLFHLNLKKKEKNRQVWKKLRCLHGVVWVIVIRRWAKGFSCLNSSKSTEHQNNFDSAWFSWSKPSSWIRDAETHLWDN